MKNLIFLIFIMTSILGCKRGYQDPLISFESRKSRLSGDWTVSSYESKIKTVTNPSVGNQRTHETKEIIKGAEINIHNHTNDGNNINMIDEAGGVEYSINFTPEGTFEMTKEYSVVSAFEETQSNSRVVMDVIHTTRIGSNIKRKRSRTIKQKGTWNFLGDVEQEFNENQRIVLNILSESTQEIVSDNKTIVTTKVIKDIEVDTSVTSTTIGEPFTTNANKDTEVTYANGENSQIWNLTRLSDDQVIAQIDAESKRKSTRSFTSSQDGSNSYHGKTVTSSGYEKIILQKTN
ncbi:MAG: hypothetical protein MRY83_22680 [Flavobacteriales bacterium]|nr:hypothetical protein [Flavobacteriales bacterium]